MVNTKPPKSTAGIVVLLDALGSKSHTVTDSIHFIEKVKASIIPFREEALGNIKIEPRTFGDTVLFSWEFSNHNLYDLVRDVITCTGLFLAESFENKIPFRGAISVGEFLVDELTILGPAVSDAAAWHDKADWCGCMATPKFFHWVNQLVLSGTIPAMPNLFLCDVPLKESKKLRTWAIEWAGWITMESPQKRLQEFIGLCSSMEVPYGTEQKYTNSIKFHSDCYSQAVKSCTSETVLQEYSLDQETIKRIHGEPT